MREEVVVRQTTVATRPASERPVRSPKRDGATASNEMPLDTPSDARFHRLSSLVVLLGALSLLSTVVLPLLLPPAEIGPVSPQENATALVLPFQPPEEPPSVSERALQVAVTVKDFFTHRQKQIEFRNKAASNLVHFAKRSASFPSYSHNFTSNKLHSLLEIEDLATRLFWAAAVALFTVVLLACWSRYLNSRARNANRDTLQPPARPGTPEEKESPVIVRKESEPIPLQAVLKTRPAAPGAETPLRESMNEETVQKERSSPREETFPQSPSKAFESVSTPKQSVPAMATTARIVTPPRGEQLNLNPQERHSPVEQEFFMPGGESEEAGNENVPTEPVGGEGEEEEEEEAVPEGGGNMAETEIVVNREEEQPYIAEEEEEEDISEAAAGQPTFGERASLKEPSLHSPAARVPSHRAREFPVSPHPSPASSSSSGRPVGSSVAVPVSPTAATAQAVGGHTGGSQDLQWRIKELEEELKSSKDMVKALKRQLVLDKFIKG